MECNTLVQCWPHALVGGLLLVLHFALGTEACSPQPTKEARTTSEWPDGESSSRNAPMILMLHQFNSSKTLAAPCPVPTHNLSRQSGIVTTPHFCLRRRISLNSCTLSFVPVQPGGCPSAIAPPFIAYPAHLAGFTSAPISSVARTRMPHPAPSPHTSSPPRTSASAAASR